ncbi:NADPH-dependent FMN reductase [Kerstersia similis]|uniref:NADPH-dependent FMN reductase n=1 Tax=Kerstersia similis TaxID=206505 RepID=UPI0039F083A2
MSIIAIAGSPSARSRSNALLRYTAQALAQQHGAVDSLSLRDISAEDLVHGNYAGQDALRLRQRVAPARVVLIATPVYKASFAGGLKALLDLLDQTALAGKIVLPLATGGSAAHLLALEYSLKPVLSALGARHILAGVYATEAQVKVDEHGQAQFDDSIRERLDAAIAAVSQLLPAPEPQPSYDLGHLASQLQLAV